MDKIVIKGARENNLKNVNLELPKNKLIVMTGVSGSGKSSLAFDTIFAEGQRRYVESLSAYARQFLGNTEKPDVDSIEGLSPSISIDQKTTSQNPRSTVGTVTEIYDYLRLLFARVGTPYCPIHHIPISHQSVEEMTNKVMEYPEGTRMEILAPVVHGEKGTHKDLLDDLRKEGFVRVKINGEMFDLSESIELDKNKKSTIQVVVDRIVMKENVRSRLYESIETATRLAHGKVVINVLGDKELVFSEQFACPECDFSLPELEPRMFSFNAPYGACPDCKGLGVKLKIDPDLVIPDPSKSISEGAIVTLGDDTDSIYYKRLECVCKHYKISTTKAFSKLTQEEKNIVLYGSPDLIHFKYSSKSGNVTNQTDFYEGIINNLERRYMETSSEWIRDWLERYMFEQECETCHGARLQDSVLSVQIGGKNIYEVTCMSIRQLIPFFQNLKLTTEQENIARLLLKEISSRLEFLSNVGLDYLTLSRSAGTLSGGELQRIRLATQIGSALSGVLYVLDEPSIGLHQRDNDMLIATLKNLRDIGNSVIVVEHDEDTIMQCDQIIDMGVGAGRKGGEVVFQGTPEELLKSEKSLTGGYLSGRLAIEVPKNRVKVDKKRVIFIKGATEHNLKNINVSIPLGLMTCVTGVSGSGKSTLILDILYPELMKQLYGSAYTVGAHKGVTGVEQIDKVIDIDQSPIGRTPRSNPVTYTDIFKDIRELFAITPEAKKRAYNAGRFSFNKKGGRCEVCQGEGYIEIEMHFLPDMYVKCDACDGSRYNRDTLDITYKGKNIAEVLEMTVNQAAEFFDNIPKLKSKLDVLRDVGLGYIKLGQPATTLSGGEAQRVKLAKELMKRSTGKTLYLFDEPTTGLHFDDINKLIKIFMRLRDGGNTVVIIEHNLDVIKCADYLIDLGPEGGDGGGNIVFEGTVEDCVKCEKSYTGKYLKSKVK